MAAYLFSAAVTYTKQFIKNIPTTAMEIAACDMVNSIIWRAYPWRWSTAAITPIALVDGTQDYTFAPADFYRLTNVRLVRTDSTPDEYMRPLTIVNRLEPNLTKWGYGSTQLVSYEGHLSKLRLEAAASITSPTTVEIQGEYQRQVTQVTATSLSIPFPNQYYNVLIAGLSWQLYRFADDARAGSIQAVKSGGVVYTGMLGEFMASLEQMMSDEGWSAGDTIAPSEPLMAE